MTNKDLFDNETIEKFRAFSSKLYNLKHGLELYMNYLADETDASLEALCLGAIIKNYFNVAKEEFNKLEEELGVLA